MDYEERLPPEHINTSQEHPLKELFVLLAGAAALLGVAIVLVHLFSGWLVRQVPLETEQSIFSGVPAQESPDGLDEYLNARLDALKPFFVMPEGMEVRISVSSDDSLNAFAAPGSHIVLMRGLLEKLPHENALSMLLAHELAHLVHRDPLVSMARGASVSLLLALAGGDSDLKALGGVTEMAMLGFSRQMEDKADFAGLKALGGVYGHSAGAVDLFKVLQAAQGDGLSAHVPAFLSTHPDLAERITLLPQRSRELGYASEGELTPLPQNFADWLQALVPIDD